MASNSRPQRLQVMLDADELAALDDWRFDRRMPSRASAVRELLRLGLAAEGRILAKAGEASTSFGVLKNRKGPKKIAPHFIACDTLFWLGRVPQKWVRHFGRCRPTILAISI